MILMAKKKKLTQNQREYQKELKRIQRYIKRAEKQGYRFDKTNLIPKKSSDNATRKRDIEKLKKLTPAKLREHATAISEVTGKVISGVERFKEHLSETHKRKRKPKTSSKLDDLFITQRRKKDEEDVIRAKRISELTMIKDNLNDLLTKYPTKGAYYLRNLFEYEIKKYGEKAVLLSLKNMPIDSIQLAQDIVFYEDDKESAARGIQELAGMIKAYIPTEDELKEMGDILDEVGNFTFTNVSNRRKKK